MEFLEDLFGDLFEGRKQKRKGLEADDDNYDDDPGAHHQEQRPQTLTCGSCSKPNPVIANFCMHCGNKLVKERFCSKCGEKHDEAARFCSLCGTQLQG